ncbi:DMT family transporter [Pseudoalteromonas sp. YIC-656]|uniref:DMT family transporter n=1 Tax=Pseudoalteromonas pernae TaxID=3118054 RepID=UPI003242CDD5
MLKWLCAALAMVAFALNSLLNREALAGLHLDSWSFAFIRTFSGAVMLLILDKIIPVKRSYNAVQASISWWGAIALSTYMLGFSLAYVQLDAGIGALLLFSAVQFTMIAYAVFVAKERFSLWQWLMLAAALGAFVALVRPSNGAIAISGAAMMVIAGVAWGVYSILGKGAEPRTATRIHFTRSALIMMPIAAVALLFFDDRVWTEKGFMLAVTSGAITSALGYSLWYFVVARIKTSQASIMQLSVPPIALVLGALLLQERLSQDTIFLCAILLGAILAFTLLRYRQ